MALHNAPLGKSSEYPDQYDPSLLFPVAREENRRRIGLEDGRWPWFGEDLWQAWEISWLRPGGVPAVAWAEIRFPAASPSIIESKSLKLYLNSLNQAVFSTVEQVAETITADLSSACGAAVDVRLLSVDESAPAEKQLPGHRPAGLGNGADPLSGQEDRSIRPVALHRQLSPEAGLSRALRGNGVYRPDGPLQTGTPDGVCTLYPQGWAGYQSVAQHQP